MIQFPIVLDICLKLKLILHENISANSLNQVYWVLSKNKQIKILLAAANFIKLEKKKYIHS